MGWILVTRTIEYKGEEARIRDILERSLLKSVGFQHQLGISGGITLIEQVEEEVKDGKNK